MSKLLEKLERVTKGIPAPMGFAASASREKAPAILWIGAIAKDLHKGAQLLREASADAALLSTAPKTPGLEQATKALGGIPWGTAPHELNPSHAQSLRDAACDFWVLEPGPVPLDFFKEDSGARLLVVKPDMEERFLRTLEDLPIDAVVLRLPQLRLPMNLAHLMDIGVVRTATSKYLLLECPTFPSAQELEHLRDAGVEGLVINVDGVAAQELAEFQRRLVDLPRRKAREERLSAVLPRVSVARPQRLEEEEEEGEEEQ